MRRRGPIALAQLEHFKSGDTWLSGTPLYVMTGLVAATMAIVYLLPRLTRAVPPALVAISRVSSRPTMAIRIA